jgi:hypothetical protein
MRDGDLQLGAVGGLRLSARPSAAFCSLALAALLTALAVVLLRAPLPAAVLGAVLAVALHWFSDIFHHLGHARAARRTGYPMIGVRLWFLLGSSEYPADEPALPAATHIRRALGGPLASLLLTLLAATLALPALLLRLPFWEVAVFFFLDNLLVFLLGAFLPLGFTDGSTLLRWLRKRAG